MYLGIEIGGTKLQLAVGPADGSKPVETRRCEVDREAGAQGILRDIQLVGSELLRKHEIKGAGIGFGGPVDVVHGRVTTSHQVHGWDNFPLVAWCHETLGVKPTIDNDCNVAALAEGLFGAGRGRRVVFYVTVGTGVGGGLVIDGKPFGSARPAVAEIGHLRPDIHFATASDTVESLASGLGIVSSVRRLVALNRGTASVDERRLIDDALPSIRNPDQFCQQVEAACGELRQLTGQQVASLARDGNLLARVAIDWSARALGWAVAQVITLLAPEIVIVGGGVPEMPAELFFLPLTSYVDQYIFPPLRNACEIRKASLGELVVVHGALALAERGH